MTAFTRVSKRRSRRRLSGKHIISITGLQNFGELLNLRIVIYLSEVIVRDCDLFGDCVIIAAHLKATAESGGILRSEATHDQLTGELRDDFGVVQNFTLKIFSGHVQVRRWRNPSAWPAIDDLDRPIGAWQENVPIIFVEIARPTAWSDATFAGIGCGIPGSGIQNP